MKPKLLGQHMEYVMALSLNVTNRSENQYAEDSLSICGFSIQGANLSLSLKTPIIESLCAKKVSWLLWANLDHP